MKQVKHIPIRYDVPASTEVTLAATVPIDGVATQALIHWPSGCNALVEVAIIYDDKRVLPEKEDLYYALNDATPTFKLAVPVKRDGKFKAVLRNFDGANTHSISLDITVESE